jgi:hypothetical protein
VLQRIAVERLAARVVTGPLAFFVAGTIDLAVFTWEAIRFQRARRRAG